MKRMKRIKAKEQQRRRNQSLYHTNKAVLVTSSGQGILVKEDDLQLIVPPNEPVNEDMLGKKLGDVSND